MIEILFIIGFSLHNIEEALWLPKWSKSAGKYHKEISVNQFRFAVIVITIIGYLFTFQYFLFSEKYMLSKLLYLSFVAMMVLNVIFPHLLATIVMKKYAPGLITGVLLNMPIGLYLIIENINDKKETRALHGLTRSLIYNMVTGVNEPFVKTLEINGSGYKAQLNGTKLALSLGLSHPCEMEAPKGITFEVPAPNRIVVKGADKQLVGETAARIRSKRVPDPYKGKGIKYDYEILHLKEGKTGAK